MAEEMDTVSHGKEFMDVFMHELRNLIGPMHNAVHLIKLRQPNDRAVVDALQIIDRQLAKMLQLIERAVDAERINCCDTALEPRSTAVLAQKFSANLNDSTSANASAANGRQKILIVDDNPMLCTTLTEILMELGYQVQEAHNGEEALMRAEQWQPDYVFIDINIPPPNGYEVARRLRSGFSGEMKLVMLSGVTFTDATIRSARQAGFDHCFDKTDDPATLVEWLGWSTRCVTIK